MCLRVLFWKKKGEMGKGLKSSYEFILLFKSLSFPLFPSKIKTHKHTLSELI